MCEDIRFKCKVCKTEVKPFRWDMCMGLRALGQWEGFDNGGTDEFLEPTECPKCNPPKESASEEDKAAKEGQ